MLVAICDMSMFAGAEEEDGCEGAGAKKPRTVTLGAATAREAFKSNELIVLDRSW